MKHLQKEEPFSSLLTPADDLAFDIPLAQHGKEKGHGIDNGDSQAQFCWIVGSITLGFETTTGEEHKMGKKAKTETGDIDSWAN